MKTNELLTNFVNSRNNAGKIIASFGYGSGLFKQSGYTLQSKPMIDTIFVVENPHLWHQENIKKNPTDYSISGKIILKYFDINAIKCSTGVTYQTNIQFMNNTFKYGIISKKKFIDSMNGNWDNLFIQGRFHKPVYTIFSTDEIDHSININRKLAIFVALLTLRQDKPTLIDLYHQICSLSYKGDIRMLFAENPNKIRNIVSGSFEELYAIYGSKNEYFYTKENGTIIINYDLLYNSLSLLPYTLYDYLQINGYLTSCSKSITKILDQKISSINKRDSIMQPLSGIATVGAIHSICYLGKKIKKKTMSL